MTKIHPTAIIENGAQIDNDVEIGPYCTVSAQAVIKSGTKLTSHVVIVGNTSIGNNNIISPFAVLGGKTQDLKYKGGNPGVKIGDNNTIREYVTINAATNDGDFTILGNDCLIMAYSHVAHCCNIGNQVIIANAVQIAGHVEIQDQATIEGMVGIVQFLRIGRLAFIGALTKITKDLPPFMIAHGDPVDVRGFNKIGMDRRGCSSDAQKSIKEAYKILYRSNNSISDSIKKIEVEVKQTDELVSLINFCRTSDKGIIR